MKYYVYQLIDPRTGLAFYIGKGSRFRHNQHLNETAESTCNQYKYRKIQSIRRSGHEPIIDIIQRFEYETDAYELEKELISSTPNLTNIHPGGHGGVGNPGWSTDNPSSKVKGKTYEERYGDEKADWMRRIRSSKLSGRTFSDESKQRMAASALKRDHSYKNKRVHTPVGTFDSMTEAATALGKSPSTMTARVKSANYPEYYYTD